MLQLRRDQMAALDQMAQDQFEQRMLRSLIETYPRECGQAGGEPQILKLVRQGVAAAELAGYTTVDQVAHYIGLSFILGVDFMHDPQLPWVTACLDEETIPDATFRIHNLYDETLDYLGATAGEESEHIVRAMIRIRDFNLSLAPVGEDDAWEADVCAVLAGFYPQKFAFQGEEATRDMIRAARKKASDYGIEGSGGLFILASEMFMMGSGFDRDLLYPWAQGTLTDPRITSGIARVEQLYRAAILHLNQSLSS